MVRQSAAPARGAENSGVSPGTSGDDNPNGSLPTVEAGWRPHVSGY